MEENQFTQRHCPEKLCWLRAPPNGHAEDCTGLFRQVAPTVLQWTQRQRVAVKAIYADFRAGWDVVFKFYVCFQLVIKPWVRPSTSEPQDPLLNGHSPSLLCGIVERVYLKADVNQGARTQMTTCHDVITSWGPTCFVFLPLLAVWVPRYVSQQ